MQEATCFEVWQNRFLYLGVVIGNLGQVAGFLIRFLISMKIYELITRKINTPTFQTVWSLKIIYLFTILCYAFSCNVNLQISKSHSARLIKMFIIIKL